MIHMKAQWVHAEITKLGSDVCGKATHHDSIVDPSEFARLPDIARCPHCVWFLHDDMFHGRENSIFHVLWRVGKNVKSICGKSVGINEIGFNEFRQLPRERKCTQCANLVRWWDHFSPVS